MGDRERVKTALNEMLKYYDAQLNWEGTDVWANELLTLIQGGEPVAEVDFGRTRSISWLAPLNNLPNHAKLYLQPGRDHKFKRWMVDELIELAEALPEDMERISRIAAAIASLFEDPTP